MVICIIKKIKIDIWNLNTHAQIQRNGESVMKLMNYFSDNYQLYNNKQKFYLSIQIQKYFLHNENYY